MENTLALLLAALLASPVLAAPTPIQKDAESFVNAYAGYYQGLYTVAQEASWAASTDVTPEHDGMRIAANKAMASFTGSRFAIEQAKRYLARKAELKPLTVRQLRKIQLEAAENPATLPEIVAKRVEAESRQSSVMDSFQFCLQKSTDGACSKPVTANDIDDLLLSTRDLSVRLQVWNASKETGPALKSGLAELQALRNAVARDFGFSSYFALQAADYGMTTAELSAMLDGLLRDIQPLYGQVHCWAKHKLAERYGQPVPKRIPAHWIANRWGQEWPGIVEGVDLDPYFKGRPQEWFVKTGEDWYVSLGFERLPKVFWEKSDLYALPADAKRKKNTHASAWHMDLENDQRSLMNIQPDTNWFKTTHHELGHIFYYQAYTRPEVPVLLRRGANRAFHEGIAELGSMAATRQSYLKRLGVLPADKQIDPTQWLLNEALVETVTFLPWAAGTITAWEKDLYENDLSTAQWNARWWDYVSKYQGIEPPAPRGEEFCDACTKTHVNDAPAYYYNYAVATILKYHLHAHICRNILKTEPYACEYTGHKEVGDFLKGIMAAGATRDWRELIKEKTGSELSTKAMMDYFQPLRAHLQKENAGRDCRWE
ncbi:MAG TPA: peptidase [Elusimicrobia bacterium]|nr:peptidase [Elusimicrobiota bacterium]